MRLGGSPPGGVSSFARVLSLTNTCSASSTSTTEGANARATLNTWAVQRVRGRHRTEAVVERQAQAAVPCYAK